MTAIPTVNNKDEVISHKLRADIDFKNDIFRTASLWITNSKGEILLAQRKLDKKTDPGKWAEAVGGTVQNDDSYEETAIREAAEELGLTVDASVIVPGPKQFIATPCQYFVQWYKIVVDQPLDSFAIQPEEVEQIAWISLEQLRHEMITTPKKYIDAMPEIVWLMYGDRD